jgi:hypothetical protein
MSTRTTAPSTRRTGRWNIVIALALLLSNGLAWVITAPTGFTADVQPRLDPQIASIRDKIFSGQASGEHFEIVVTDQMASEAVAWFLARHPEVPFSHPRVRINPQGVTGSGTAYLMGLRTPVSGRAFITARNGLPVVQIQEISVAGAAAPDFILQATQKEFEAQLAQVQGFPVEISRVELGDGQMLVEGVYR